VVDGVALGVHLGQRPVDWLITDPTGTLVPLVDLVSRIGLSRCPFKPSTSPILHPEVDRPVLLSVTVLPNPLVFNCSPRVGGLPTADHYLRALLALRP
jgi:hypothetical protein